MNDFHFPTFGYIIGFAYDFLSHSMLGISPEYWWLPALVLLVLGAAATVDAFTSNVPDPLVFIGLIAVIGMQGMLQSWPEASTHLMWAMGAAFALWALNHLWYMVKKQDAIGMGDAKWTMLAMAAFDVEPVLIAWGLGACLAVVWIGGMKILQRPIRHVYFAPFLFIGLIFGIYWARMRGFTP
jgi:hypothetical protein